MGDTSNCSGDASSMVDSSLVGDNRVGVTGFGDGVLLSTSSTGGVGLAAADFGGEGVLAFGDGVERRGDGVDLVSC